jgi:hypothetical protein
MQIYNNAMDKGGTGGATRLQIQEDKKTEPPSRKGGIKTHKRAVLADGPFDILIKPATPS